MSIDSDIRAAEGRIAVILRDLERAHPGFVVMGIGLKTTEVTNMNDDRERFMQRVVIELRPNPRNEWAT